MLSIQEDARFVNGEMNNESTGYNLGHNGGPPLDEANRYPDPEGFVAIARSVRRHAVVGFGKPVAPADPERGGAHSKFEAWADLIMECKYRPGQISNNGRVMVLKPGQLLGAVSWLANRWNWTPKQVRYFLDALERHGMIERGYAVEQEIVSHAGERPCSEVGTDDVKHRGKQAHVVTIRKYELFQMVQREFGQIKRLMARQMPGKSVANQGQHYKEGTKEQRNKETKQDAAGADQLVLVATEESPKPVTPTEAQLQEAFAKFWAAFPAGRKQAKGKAYDIFKDIVIGRHKSRKATANEIVQGARRFAATKPDQKYAPMPTTWLNDGRWADHEPCPADMTKPINRPRQFDPSEDPAMHEWLMSIPGGPND